MGKEQNLVYHCSQPRCTYVQRDTRPFRCGVHDVWNWAPTCCGESMVAATVVCAPSHRCSVCNFHVDHDQNHVGVACDVPGCMRYMAKPFDAAALYNGEHTPRLKDWLVIDDVTEDKPQPDKKAALEWYDKAKTATGTAGCASNTISAANPFGDWYTFRCPPRHAKTATIGQAVGLFPLMPKAMMDEINACRDLEAQLYEEFGPDAVAQAREIARTSGSTLEQALRATHKDLSGRRLGKAQWADFVQQCMDYKPEPDDACYASVHQAIKDIVDKQMRQMALVPYTPSKTMSQIPKETRAMPISLMTTSHPQPKTSAQAYEETSKRLYEQYADRFLQVKDVKITTGTGTITLKSDSAASQAANRITVPVSPVPGKPWEYLVTLPPVPAGIRFEVTVGTGTVEVKDAIPTTELDRMVDGKKLAVLVSQDNKANQEDLEAIKARKLWTPAQREAVSAWRSMQLKKRVEKSEADRKARETTVVVGDDDLWLSNYKDAE